MNFYLAQQSAREMASNLARVAKDLFGSQQVHIKIHTDLDPVYLEAGSPGDKLEELERFATFLKEMASRPYIAAGPSHLYFPQQQNPKFELKYHETPQGWRLTVGRNEGPAVDPLKLADVLRKHFNLHLREHLQMTELSESEQRAFRLRQTAIDDLSSQTSRLGQFLTEMAEKNAKEVHRLTSELEKKHLERDAQLQEKYAAVELELEKSRQEHLAKVADFELREHTAVRRKLDEKLEKVLEKFKNVNVDKSIADRRWIIHGACVLTLVASGAMCGYLAPKVIALQSVDWFHIVPFSAVVAVFVSTLIYYLRWNHAWFAQLTNAEFGHRKSEFDIARAAWIAELLFEWKEKKEIGLPEDVLRSLTRNLFAEPQSHQGDYHPFDQVASILRRTKHLKIGGIEIDRGTGKRPQSSE